MLNLKWLDDFNEHRKYLKKKDEIAIKKVERRFKSNTRFAYKFQKKAYDIYEVFKLQVPYIVTVLKEYMDNPVEEAVFDKPFSEAQVYSVLFDTRFVAMLMCNNLLKRTANLDRDSSGLLKLRVYIAILNYDTYNKEKYPARQPNRKGRKSVAK